MFFCGAALMTTTVLQGNKVLQFQFHLGYAFCGSGEKLGDRISCQYSRPTRVGLLGMVGEAAVFMSRSQDPSRWRVFRRRQEACEVIMFRRCPASVAIGGDDDVVGKEDVQVQGQWSVECGCGVLLRRGWTERAGVEPRRDAKMEKASPVTEENFIGSQSNIAMAFLWLMVCWSTSLSSYRFSGYGGDDRWVKKTAHEQAPEVGIGCAFVSGHLFYFGRILSEWVALHSCYVCY